MESTFALTFEVETESFGEVVKHELKPGGTDIPVTAENRQEYVDLYCKWRLTEAISRPFQAFSEGFHKVRLNFRPRRDDLKCLSIPVIDIGAQCMCVSNVSCSPIDIIASRIVWTYL